MTHPAENDARERIASWLLPELAHAQAVAEASAAIKRAREGRVDPDWEGLTADDKAAETEVLGSLIEVVRAALARPIPPGVCGFDMGEGDECLLDAGHDGPHS